MGNNPYGIVHDPSDGTWWIQGNEGRVNDPPDDDLATTLRAARDMRHRGVDIDCDHYYLHDDNDGPDWSNPIPIVG